MKNICRQRLAIIELLERKPLLFSEIVSHLGERAGEHIYKLFDSGIIKKEDMLFTVRDDEIIKIKRDLKRFLKIR